MSPAVGELRRAGRGRGALHRRLPGLRRLRAHRARSRLDGADLQRLVRGLGRHARPARPARQDHRPRVHARPGQLAGGAELRRPQRCPAVGGVPRAHGAHKPTVPEALRDAKYAPQKYSFISLEGLRQRPGDRGGAAPRGPGSHAGRASGRRWSRCGTSTSASARRSTSAPSVTRGWTASTSPASRATAGFRSTTGTPPSRHERGGPAWKRRRRGRGSRGSAARGGRPVTVICVEPRPPLPVVPWSAVRPARQDHVFLFSSWLR